MSSVLGCVWGLRFGSMSSVLGVDRELDRGCVWGGLGQCRVC